MQGVRGGHALARRRRERALSPAAFAAAKRQLEADWPKYLTVQVTESLCKDAGQLAERFALRGYDFRTLIGQHAGFANVEISFPLIDVLATPVIVKYRDDRTDTRTELETWIR